MSNFLLLGLLLFCLSCQPIQEQKKPFEKLQNNTWTAVKLQEKVIGAATGFEMTLDSSSKQLKAFTNCNTFKGKYLLKGQQLHFQQLERTYNACFETIPEDKLFSVFKETTQYHLTDQTLHLLSEEQKILAIFEKRE